MTTREIVGSPSRSLTTRDILNAAASEFAARGYRGTNLTHVADRLGVTRQALYYYYPRKHDVLKAIMFEYFDGLENVVDAAFQRTSDPAERFLQMLAAHFEWVAANRVPTAVFTHEEGNLPQDERDQIMERRVRHQEKFVGVYREGVGTGAFVPMFPGLVVNTLIGAGNWAYRWFDPKGELAPADYAVLAVSLLRDGFAAGRA